ncbi:hypothetical protein SM007_32700 [Streptomyces avermitilis]|uniref:Uncharacterized protein n=1 Tax=Streptomyces avermitilis TaxID=33903 RepID=A0A4D4MI03_STRAX|nr:hypothetical protein SM007_32700 [Streptomyces avermitilis]GDY68467.1 hypothetical protein SAV14893_078600 [Streptomyces avermitilis]GDY71159.1 hypothetical protein SAV31267_006440 [Streptomyces avermitilis]
MLPYVKALHGHHALAAVHAARVAQIHTVMLDDVGPGNRRLTIAGRVRPLDDLTLKLLLDWLEHRRNRWPLRCSGSTRRPRCATRTLPADSWSDPSSGSGCRVTSKLASRSRAEGIGSQESYRDDP